ncbi:MAG: hypothetical protein BM564_03630 [Bacteroidetes bacterium MedPE-SWsnd-G2]|nr:MAG: hypothetical protein BM564_03630 [Bacteroidetes bacterium MedPE-SWsnd-G2]
MSFYKKLGPGFSAMLLLCFVIIIVAEWLFLDGQEMHGIFVGLWAPTLLLVMIFLKQVRDGSK